MEKDLETMNKKKKILKVKKIKKDEFRFDENRIEILDIGKKQENLPNALCWLYFQ